MELDSRSLMQSGGSSSRGKSKAMAKIVEEEEGDDEACGSFSSGCGCGCGCGCFFCAAKQPDARLRRASLATFFRELPSCSDEDGGVAVGAVWRAAMDAPDDSELPSLGAIRCMSGLLARALADEAWRRRGRNACVPYYAAHVIGSYTIRSSKHAELAVAAGAVRPLLALLGGAMTWVEQRAAARALGHLASYDATFPAVARYAAEAVPLAARAASVCVRDVYASYVALAPSERPQYQRDLLTRGSGGGGAAAAGVYAEDRKAEEWASQLQCWSLYFLSSIASRDLSSHAAICQDAGFLRELCQMWGGLANGDSPAGVGLLRLLCRSAAGRGAVAACRDALSGLCDLARSSDDWQYMAIDCLLLLLDDRGTWHAVADAAAPCLADLAELRHLGPRRRLGDAITSALLLDDNDVDDNAGHGRVLGTEAKEAIADVREVKVERKEREEAMSRDELLRRYLLAKEKKRRGNDMFWHGEVAAAIELYTEALELCPLSRRRERLVLHSNRAQCRLARREADAAARDATRALSLERPANAHARSLWRRAQAYDMKGMARESLLDCLAFAGAWLNRKPNGGRAPAPAPAAKNLKLPYSVARMISKQMSMTGLFAGAVAADGSKAGRYDFMPQCSNRDGDGDGDEDDDDVNDDDDDDNHHHHHEGSEEESDDAELKPCETSGRSLPIMAEQSWRRLTRGKKKMFNV